MIHFSLFFNISRMNYVVKRNLFSFFLVSLSSSSIHRSLAQFSCLFGVVLSFQTSDIWTEAERDH